MSTLKAIFIGDASSNYRFLDSIITRKCLPLKFYT
jgi:hypothetical protein